MTKKITVILLALMLMINFIPLQSQAQETYVVGNGVEIPNASIPTDGRNPYCNCGSTVGWGYHYCCWNYGYYVFYKIWGVFPERRDESLNNLREIAPEDRYLTVENLTRFLKKAAPGAILRMDRRSQVTSGDDEGHTLIFVQMNEAGDGAVFMEGNYNGRGNSRLVEWKFEDLVSSYGPNSRKGYTYIKYLLWPNAPVYIESYVDLCVEYPTYTNITAHTETDAMRFPCDSSVDPESQVVEEVKVGDSFTATNLLKNDRDELWFEITADGQRAFVPASTMDVSAPVLMDVSVSGVKAPQRISAGSSFSIQGKVVAGHGNLVGVSAYVFQGSDLTAEPVTGGYAQVYGQSYSLSGSKVDDQVRFGKLSKGEYTYAVFATVQCAYPAADGSVETKEQTVCVYQTRFLVADRGTETVTVEFDANGGFASMDKITALEGFALYDLPQAYREGYSFRGWSFDGETVIAEGLTFDEDTTLVALWMANGAWNCGHAYKTEIPGLEPNCTESGFHTYYVCKQCGSAMKADGVTVTTPEEEIIPALGHEFTAADCENPSVCTRCEEVGREAMGHSGQAAVKENVVEPTTTADGSYDSVVYCGSCGKELSRTHHTVAAIKLLGDANRDGVVDSVDALVVLQYVVGLLTDADISVENADVNEDMQIDAVDALLILQMAVGLIPGIKKQTLPE